MQIFYFVNKSRFRDLFNTLKIAFLPLPFSLASTFLDVHFILNPFLDAESSDLNLTKTVFPDGIIFLVGNLLPQNLPARQRYEIYVKMI